MSEITNQSSLYNSEQRKDEVEKQFSSYIKKSDLEQSGSESFPNNRNNNTIKIEPIPYTESEESTNDDNINRKYQKILSENKELKKINKLLSKENEKLKNENEQFKKRYGELDVKNDSFYESNELIEANNIKQEKENNKKK